MMTSSTYEKRTVCPFDCPDSCGMIAKTDGSRIISVKGDKQHPVTKGFLCRKMHHFELDIHSPQRISTPLKRVGDKGKSESFVPISWEEAIEKISAKWKDLINIYGSECILPYSYAGNMGIVQRNCGEAFFARLGAADLKRTICSSARGAGVSMVMGKLFDWQSNYLPTADLIILWGSNPKVNRLHITPELIKAKRAGARIVLIDTYRSISASLCDDVLLIRPGTDGALLLALMHMIEQNGFVDMDFIENFTTGYEDLKKEFEKWTLKKAHEITGIAEEDIKELALQYGTAKKPMIVAGSGMSRYTNGASSFRLLMCLPAIAGAWRRGGGTCSFMGSSNYYNTTAIKRPDWKKQGIRSVNMNQLGDALLNQEHKIRSLYVYHSNPAVMTPDQQCVLRGLEREDLFLIVHDRYLTDTALYADIVLPATFSVEQDDIYSSYGYYHTQVSWQIIPPVGEAKSNWDTFVLLADAMGFTDDYFRQTAGEFVKKIINDRTILTAKLSREQIERLEQGYAVMFKQPDVLDIQTSDGKIHLSDRDFFPETPAYIPLADERYPLRLVMVHSAWSLNSNFSYREDLMRQRGPLRLRINPADAGLRGIKQDSICRAFNDYGSVTVQAWVTNETPKGTVIAEGVFQKAYTFKDGNFSSLLSQELTDQGEASTLNTQTVELESISAGV